MIITDSSTVLKQVEITITMKQQKTLRSAFFLSTNCFLHLVCNVQWFRSEINDRYIEIVSYLSHLINFMTSVFSSARVSPFDELVNSGYCYKLQLSYQLFPEL